MSEQKQNEIEYIEPTQEHVGQIVEVEDLTGWKQRKLLAVLPQSQVYKFICQHGEFANHLGKWFKARVPRPKPQPTPAPVSSVSKEAQPKDTHDAPKPIDWTKPVRTKDGRAVRVLCTDGPGEYPVVGFIDGDNDPYTWTLGGQNVIDEADDVYDLENSPQRVQREYWVNVYASCLGSHHDTKEDADYHATGARLACVKITIDCEEGKGL